MGADERAARNKPQVLVYLVHGTFAPDASFQNEQGSLLIAALRKVLEPVYSVRFEQHDWGGLLFGRELRLMRRFNNSHGARILASRRLADKVAAEAEADGTDPKRPAPKVFLVGHSHGGNVALYASKVLESREKGAVLAGVACLSTPFLRLAQDVDRNWLVRQAKRAPMYLAWGMATAFAIAAGYGIVSFGPAVLEAYGVPAPWNSLLAVLATILLGVFIGSRILSSLRQMGRAEIVHRFYEDIQLPTFEPAKLFVAGTAWDEAAAALIVASGIVRLAFALLSFYPILIVIALSAYYFLVLSPDPSAISWTDKLTGAAVGSFSFLAVYVVVCMAIRFVAVSIVRFLAFGWENPFKGIRWQMWPVKTPPGLSRWRGYVPSNPGLLVHSKLYENPECLEDLAAWMRERIESS